MTLKELDLPNAVYGEIPASFQHRVQYALRRTQEEEKNVKHFAIRTLIIALVLFLADIAARKFKWKWIHEIARDRKSQNAAQA